MIFGKPYVEQWPKEKRPWFAWYPVTLFDGRTAWLETIYREYTNGEVGSWQYTLIGKTIEDMLIKEELDDEEIT